MEFVKKKVNIDVLNPFSLSPTKRSYTLKQIFSKSRQILLSVFGHSMELVLKGLQPIFVKLKPSHIFLIKMFKWTFKPTFLIKQRLITIT